MVSGDIHGIIEQGSNVSDLFNTNASIVRDLAKACADSAPNANLLIISNPVRCSIDEMTSKVN